ncbi:MAG: hypothetical protein HCTETUND1_138 [Candidatus Hodgkinia cicadicola]|nr:MAG: hypothetical protein HCTETUND1_138 [Candidatus Hodgkinia cicadicola]
MWVLILSAQTELFSVSAIVLSALPSDSLIVAIAHGSFFASLSEYCAFWGCGGAA